ncbi:MAG: UDP-N-acetyl-2-amino-2-deoxy-D-glucuronate oxidase [Ignavibacteria bacterium]|nr:MAG: UDP-N-acetyl-2-amino-2-deoxy-D-glucuronate oxidase [Ignavibacteria bacterium]
MKNFAITSVAGYISPRHLKAIKEIGDNSIAAVDLHDSVGILDQFFPYTRFFTEFERFDRHLEKIRRKGEENKTHFLTICPPNNLHDAHIRLALRIGADAICEKPLVLNPWNLDALQELETETGSRVYTILQLRVHPNLIELKNKIAAEKKSKKYPVSLTYVTSRGLWYDFSWKGIKEKSRGEGTNIGIHIFDLLICLFGSVQNSELHLSKPKKMAGFIELDNADVTWFLSADRDDLPAELIEKKVPTFRSIEYDGNKIQFSSGFTDLHTRVYEETLAGNGFGIEDARPSIHLVHELRGTKVIEKSDTIIHPMAEKYYQR